jgi:hypothetical protein
MCLMTDNKWARLLAYVTGQVNQKLLLQNGYLAAENRILRAHLVRSRNSSNTLIPRGIWTEFPLHSVGSPSTGIHNLSPEQELHKHTEHPRDHDHLPSA